MDKGQQFQDPSIGVSSSYTPPQYATNGNMLFGHMVTAHDTTGLPLGFIEWGHKTTPHGKAVVIGNHGDTQERADAVFNHLWSQAQAHEQNMGLSTGLDRSKGLSHYESPGVYDASGKLL